MKKAPPPFEVTRFRRKWQAVKALVERNWQRNFGFEDDYRNDLYEGWRCMLRGSRDKWTLELTSRSREGYDRTKDACDGCGITEEERQKKPPMATGIAHFEHAYTKSFSLDTHGGVWCPECHKERELKSLFDLTDRRDARRKAIECLDYQI